MNFDTFLYTFNSLTKDGAVVVVSIVGGLTYSAFRPVKTQAVSTKKAGT